MVILDNIGIRAIEVEDLRLLQGWRNDARLRRYFREHREFSHAQKNSWYETMIKSSNNEMFVIVDLERDESIGVTGLTYIDWVNRHADVHFYIGKDAQWIDDKYSPTAIKIILGYGYLTLNLNKLWVEIYEIDDKKLDFFKKIGFSIDGKLREHYYHEGKYHTSNILSLLKSEYKHG